jgi:oligoendopeptidase F
MIMERNKRTFLSEDFEANNWETIEPYYNNLLERKINTIYDLKEWLKHRSELESAVSEELGWRYIRMTCDTTNEEHRKNFEYFVSEIEPKVAPNTDKLNKKVNDSPFLKEISDPGYLILRRSIEKDIKIFREKNIPLLTEIQTESQKFGAISGAMTVEVDGKELTLQQAGDFLQSPDRKVREEVFRKINERKLQDKNALNDLFTHLINLRNQVALNADFKNFRDYMFVALGRFDYSVDDCRKFHDAVQDEAVPLLNGLAQERKEALKVDELRPWDLKVDEHGKEALKPFASSEELLNNTILLFKRLNPYLGECLEIMKQMGHFDLESRKGKAPGGYNYPLAEIGVPFIFMNATSNLRDLVTLLHEGGHAVHSFLTRDLELNDFKNTPSEVAELASMSMELISMDHWDIFFKTEDELKRAKREHLKQIIETLPWVATIDKFQHLIYENPGHSIEERTKAWLEIYNSFSDKVTNWSGLERYKEIIWQKQLHLFEVPFYYIEYGMAQLGAIAVWKNYKEDKNKGLEGYQNALKLGYTKSIPEVYQAAGIKFDFSKAYIKELMTFLKEELEKL